MRCAGYVTVSTGPGKHKTEVIEKNYNAIFV